MSAVRLPGLSSALSILRARPWRGLAIAACGSIVGILVVGIGQRDRITFVTPCIWNGNTYADCTCTHAAMPNLPDAYKPVARSWAHETSTQYASAVMSFAFDEAKQAVLNQLPSLPDGDDLKLDPTKLKSWWSNAGGLTGIVKRLSSAAAKKVAAPGTVADVANDLTSNLVKARTAFSKSCGGTADRMFAAFDDFKSDVAQRADDLGIGTAREAASLATKAKQVAANAGSWFARRWDGLWR